MVGVLMYSNKASQFAGSKQRAVFLAEEGIEAVRNIRDEAFINLNDSTYGRGITGNTWSLSGANDTIRRAVALCASDAHRIRIERGHGGRPTGPKAYADVYYENDLKVDPQLVPGLLQRRLAQIQHPCFPGR